jgi:hypothetical protein
MYEELSETEKNELVEKIASYVVERELQTPAILFLQSFKPNAILGSQLAIVTMSPYFGLFDLTHEWGPRLIQLMQEQSNIERIIQRIEELSKERNDARKAEKMKLKDQQVPSKRGFFDRVRSYFAG